MMMLKIEKNHLLKQDIKEIHKNKREIKENKKELENLREINQFNPEKDAAVWIEESKNIVQNGNIKISLIF